MSEDDTGLRQRKVPTTGEVTDKVKEAEAYAKEEIQELVRV